MTVISNFNVLVEPIEADLQAIRDGEDPFDPTEEGKREVDIDDDFDDIELGEPQACDLETCESCQ